VTPAHTPEVVHALTELFVYMICIVKGAMSTQTAGAMAAGQAQLAQGVKAYLLSHLQTKHSACQHCCVLQSIDVLH
jgi:hypothetical protein